MKSGMHRDWRGDGGWWHGVMKCVTHYLILQVLGDLVHLFGGQQDATSLLEGLDEANDAGLHHSWLLAPFAVTLHQASLGEAAPLQAPQLPNILIELPHLRLHGLSRKEGGGHVRDR